MSVISESRPGGAAGWKALRVRAAGIVVSPRATYERVVAHPRTFGMLFLAMAVSAAALGVFLSTGRGQTVFVDRQMTTAEAFGLTVSDATLEWMKTPAARLIYVAGQILLIPLTTLAVAVLGMAIFRAPATQDAAATFKQAVAVAAHSQIIGAVATVLIVPLDYARQTMSNPANLSAVAPMLDDTSFVSRLLGSIDLFRAWWIVNLSIGFSVLFKRGTSRFAWVLLGAYLTFAAVVAGVMAVLSGV